MPPLVFCLDGPTPKIIQDRTQSPCIKVSVSIVVSTHSEDDKLDDYMEDDAYKSALMDTVDDMDGLSTSETLTEEREYPVDKEYLVEIRQFWH